MTGPKIIFTIPIFNGIPVTETVVNTWIVMAVLVLLSIFLTHNMQKVPKGKQVLVEKGVAMLYNLVENTMGKDKLSFAPYMGTLMLMSLFCSLSSLFGFRPPTADLNTTLCWALITFFMVQINGLRRKGLKKWLKSFAEPVVPMLPLNIISEFSNPISLTFRHFGNIAGGMVITSLLYSGLAALTSIVFNGLQIPILQIGLPAILSIYFDLFTSIMQAFIFCMLSMVFISMAMDD